MPLRLIVDDKMELLTFFSIKKVSQSFFLLNIFYTLNKKNEFCFAAILNVKQR